MPTRFLPYRYLNFSFFFTVCNPRIVDSILSEVKKCYVTFFFIVQRVQAILDLGIILDCGLTFHDHVEAVVAKSLKLLGFIKRSTVDFSSAHSIICIVLLYYLLSRMSQLYGHLTRKLRSKNLSLSNTGILTHPRRTTHPKLLF